MRIALVAGADAGHAFPAAALAVRLARAGHRPVLVTAPRWLGALATAGIEAQPLPEFPPPAGSDFGYLIHGRAGEMAPALRTHLGAIGPDLIVADLLAPAAALAAELLDRPWVELVPHPLHLPSRALPPPGSGFAPGRTPLGRARDAILRRAAARSQAEGAAQRARARVSLGLPGPQSEPAARLVATLPGLEPPRPDWPDRTHVVGPLAWDPATTDLVPPEGSGPLVLVVPSTASSGRSGLIEAALEGLTGVRLVGVQWEPYAGMLPSSALVGTGRLAPLLEAADVVVAGGGHGLLSRALQAGRPMVLVPGGGDQRDLARRVARAGAGIAVPRLTPGRLARAVRTIVGRPSYAAAARRIAGRGQPEDPVRICERAARGRG
ncbi:MAG TPA: nucleotide disphospho-sugar-binding domain-containing protein [Mycobacteriales bacterium]|nr:nucleotide disphospho-sugar-binding domain-containing protein [Mycobacteriales bacterium]